MADTVYIATRIDGDIARKDGSIDWLMELPNPNNNDYGFSVFLERIDGGKTIQSFFDRRF